MMKILNLYAGIGGNRRLWGDEHEIHAIDNNKVILDTYLKLYPNDNTWLTDAMDYLYGNIQDYDFIWASPPCQTHSTLNHMQPDKLEYVDMSLWQIILFLQKHCTDKLWVVENVEPWYDTFIQPTTIIGRHWYWSNFPINFTPVELPKNFRTYQITELEVWLEFGLENRIPNYRQILRNCIHPRDGLAILQCALSQQSLEDWLDE